uniref:Transporter n=1 Tax=Strigamia maritima TaxID=126957 RepID=T1IPV6_STRMM
MSLRTGFEPAREIPIGFQVQRLNHSAIAAPFQFRQSPADIRMASSKTVSKILINHERGHWSNKVEFILSCVCMSVGIANVWRYPYVAYENGGGTFQIPYVILSIFVGYPLYYLEMARGQYSQSGALGVWHSCPAAIGIGWGMMVTLFIGFTYYIVIISYTMIYMVLSFAKELPWTSCSSWWGADDNCYIRTKVKYVLNIDVSDGIEHPNALQWRIVLALAVTWFVIFLCVFKGIKTIGKAVYVAALLPYVILLALLIQGLLLDGATERLVYIFNPNWSKLLEIKVWFNAAQQLVFSLGLAHGGIIAIASFNQFNNNLQRDALLVVGLDYMTSLMASTVVFAVIGFLSKGLSLNSEEIFAGGQGLVFITFPEVFTLLPLPQLWCFMFFLMLFALGTGSASGQYVLNLVDNYNTMGRTLLLAWEVIAVTWIYGLDKFCEDVKLMINAKPNRFLRIAWKYICPTVILALTIASWSMFTPPKYGCYHYPTTAHIFGWIISLKCTRMASSSSETTVQPTRKRKHWSNKIEFLLSCIGLSVGIGNVWRYPYIAFENGGGTFQIPYVILSILVGYPLYYLEIARGQYSQRGALAVWHSCPAAIGIGWGMIFSVVIGITYYNVIISYTIRYRGQIAAHGGELIRIATLDHSKFVLNIDASGGIENLNVPQWRLVSALAATWIFIFLCVFKGIKTSGKAVYVTATLPYIILLALLIQGLLLDGATDGLLYFFNPNWNKLLEIKVWYNAAQQLVYSLSLANGGLITLASYNRFHNKFQRDAVQVVLLDFMTSVMASTVVFAVIGSLAKNFNSDHVNMNKLFAGGQGLAFIIFPEVVTLLPVPQLWCFMFFLMLFTLGIDSTFASVEALWTAVFDDRPMLEKYQTQLYFISCIGGQYVLNLVDNYSVMGRTLLLAWEVVAVMWIYGLKIILLHNNFNKLTVISLGLDKFCQDVNRMLGFKPNILLQISWKYICPVVIIALTIASWSMFTPPKYGCYYYPVLAHIFGWFLSLIIIFQPIIWAVIVVYQHWRKGVS